MQTFKKIQNGIKAFRAETNTEPVTMKFTQDIIDTFQEEDIIALEQFKMPHDVLHEMTDVSGPVFQLSNAKHAITFTLT